MLRRTKQISLVMVAAIAAAACDENKTPSPNDELKHCVDENGVVQDEEKCKDAPVQPPTGSDGGPAQHSGGGGGHFFWYYGGSSTPVTRGTRVTGGSYAPSVGKSYSPPSIGRGGFGSTGAGHGSTGGGS